MVMTSFVILEEEEPVVVEYILGLDLGQVGEFTALVIVEKHGRHGEEDKATFHVREMRRYEPGTGYPKILADLAGLIEAGPLKGKKPAVIIDGTSAGAAVVEMFRRRMREQRIELVAALITGGDADTRDDHWWRIPKRDLVSSVQAALQTQRLKIARELPESGTLIRELEQFKAKVVISAAADALVAWREGVNDDLVLALALAVWEGGKLRPRWFCV